MKKFNELYNKIIKENKTEIIKESNNPLVDNAEQAITNLITKFSGKVFKMVPELTEDFRAKLIKTVNNLNLPILDIYSLENRLFSISRSRDYAGSEDEPLRLMWEAIAKEIDKNCRN